MRQDPLSNRLPRMLKGIAYFDQLFGGGSSPQAQPIDLMKQLLQIYQGTALTAGPMANLNANVQPVEGQTALNLQQQQMFGYNPGSGASTPPGGFIGQPYGSSGGTTGSSSTGTGGSGTGLYSPPSDTRIGFGNTFSDPYAGTTPPSQTSGWHPGVLSLNTTALADYGPAGTMGLLQSNPYLASALNAQNQNIQNASQPGLLGQLNPLASQQLSTAYGNDPLNTAQQRNSDQGALSLLGQGGMVNGNTGIASQLFGRQAAIEHGQDRANAFASGVQQLDTAQQGLLGNLTSQAGQTAYSTLTNPLLGILNLPGFSGTGSPSSTIANQTALGAPAFDLGSSVAGYNANAANAANIAGANQSAAQSAALMNLLGSVFSGLGTG